MASAVQAATGLPPAELKLLMAEGYPLAAGEWGCPSTQTCAAHGSTTLAVQVLLAAVCEQAVPLLLPGCGRPLHPAVRGQRAAGSSCTHPGQPAAERTLARPAAAAAVPCGPHLACRLGKHRLSCQQHLVGLARWQGNQRCVPAAAPELQLRLLAWRSACPGGPQTPARQGVGGREERCPPP